jgi:hypothetical protein
VLNAGGAPTITLQGASAHPFTASNPPPWDECPRSRGSNEAIHACFCDAPRPRECGEWAPLVIIEAGRQDRDDAQLFPAITAD